MSVVLILPVQKTVPLSEALCRASVLSPPVRCPFSAFQRTVTSWNVIGKTYGFVIVMFSVVPDRTNGPCVTLLQLGTFVGIIVGVEEGVNVAVGGGVLVVVGVEL